MRVNLSVADDDADIAEFVVAFECTEGAENVVVMLVRNVDGLDGCRHGVRRGDIWDRRLETTSSTQLGQSCGQVHAVGHWAAGGGGGKGGGSTPLMPKMMTMPAGGKKSKMQQQTRQESRTLTEMHD